MSDDRVREQPPSTAPVSHPSGAATWHPDGTAPPGMIPRCGAARTDGGVCYALVSDRGAHCYRHRGADKPTAYTQGAADERARILALLDDPEVAYRIAQGFGYIHHNFITGTLAAVRALIEAQ